MVVHTNKEGFNKSAMSCSIRRKLMPWFRVTQKKCCECRPLKSMSKYLSFFSFSPTKYTFSLLTKLLLIAQTHAHSPCLFVVVTKSNELFFSQCLFSEKFVLTISQQKKANSPSKFLFSYFNFLIFDVTILFMRFFQLI